VGPKASLYILGGGEKSLFSAGILTPDCSTPALSLCIDSAILAPCSVIRLISNKETD